jgi:hypothetical protein
VTEELQQDGVSRRTALKRLGAGAAVAWSAPALMSVGTRAFAASPSDACPAPCTTCFSFGNFENFGFPDSAACGGVPAPACMCSGTAEGDCFCAANAFGSGPCTTSADCLANERCMSIASNFCDPNSKFCLPGCSAGAGGAGGARPASAS